MLLNFQRSWKCILFRQAHWNRGIRTIDNQQYYRINQKTSKLGRNSTSSVLRILRELLICSSTVRFEIESWSDISWFDKPRNRLISNISRHRGDSLSILFWMIWRSSVSAKYWSAELFSSLVEKRTKVLYFSVTFWCFW